MQSRLLLQNEIPDHAFVHPADKLHDKQNNIDTAYQYYGLPMQLLQYHQAARLADLHKNPIIAIINLIQQNMPLKYPWTEKIRTVSCVPKRSKVKLPHK